MHKVVVTGGLGFIGSHVVDALIADGREVTIIDSMVAAVTEGSEYESSAQVHRVSIADYLAQGGSFKSADLVVHAASHVGPAGILKHQGNLGADIVATTQQVVEECVEHDVALISFSSAEVYGRSGMLAEQDDIIVPTHYNARLEYAIAKTLTEAATINSRHRGLRGFVIRPFNVGGPRQSRASSRRQPIRPVNKYRMKNSSEPTAMLNGAIRT
jgi:nucleoside-diphosphate-sugar epimerase